MKKKIDPITAILLAVAGALIVGIGVFAVLIIANVKPQSPKESDTTPVVSSEDADITTPADSEDEVNTTEPSESESPTETSEEDTTTTEEPATTVPPTTVPPATTAPPATPAPPVTQAPVPQNSGPIHGLSEAELNDIAARYEMARRNCGTGFGGGNGSTARYCQQLLLNAGVTSGVFFCAPANEKKVAFSFQGGYINGHENEILDILSQKGVKATFYITRNFANVGNTHGNVQVIHRMINEGHEIGSHSYADCVVDGSRGNLTALMNDALQMQSYMQNNYGYTMRKYNFFGGDFSVASCAMFEKMGYQLGFLSMNYDDWQRDGTRVYDVNSTLNGLKNALHPGCVYCFHMTNVITVQILLALIDYCRAQGYQIVMVP